VFPVDVGGGEGKVVRFFFVVGVGWVFVSSTLVTLCYGVRLIGLGVYDLFGRIHLLVGEGLHCRHVVGGA
jgi:hypothetical protein